jgi:hypothetical protein
VSILYYAAKNASNYYALWSTNGSASATFDVLTATQTFGSTSPYGFTTLGDDVIFAAQEATTYFAVWVSGGTSATTFELLSSQQGGYTLSPQDFVGVGGEALFEGRDSDNREAVFATAGVSGDPSVLLEFNKPLTRLQGFGAFAIASEASPAGGAEIWFTNGTTALTSLLYSQASFSDYDDDFFLVKAGAEAVLEATDASGSRGVFTVQGATGAFAEVETSQQGIYTLDPTALVAAGDEAFFGGD